MDVSRETPDVTTKPKWYDLTNILVTVDDGAKALPPCGRLQVSQQLRFY